MLLLLGGRELNPGLGSGASSSAPYSKVGTGDGELSLCSISSLCLTGLCTLEFIVYFFSLGFRG